MSRLTRFSELEPIPCESRWFVPYRVAEGVTAIAEPYHFQEVISYLIEGRDRALLLDSGMGLGNIRALVGFLTEKPVILVNSHTHFDHVGDNWRFPETHLLNVPEYVTRLERGEVFQPDRCNRSQDALHLDGPAWFDLESWRTKPCRVVPVEDGHCFELGGRTLRVLATPGHTRDSIMLADDASRFLFTGDTVYPAPLYAYIEGLEMIPVYQETISRLAEEYSEYSLFCSHNNPLWEGSALKEIDRAFRDVLGGRAVGRADSRTAGDNVCYSFGDFGLVLTREAAVRYGAAFED